MSQQANAVTYEISAIDEMRALMDSRFESGEYQPLPNAVIKTLWEYDIAINPSDYLHLSTQQPGKVAFTPDDRHLIEDRQIRSTLAKYLKRMGYLANADIPAQVFSKLAGMLKADNWQLEFAETVEQWEEVYTLSNNGPCDSCMSYDASEYDTDGTHPTAAYVRKGNGLKLAYLRNDDTIVARAIVRHFDNGGMQYNRIYGDYDLMRPLLENAGYVENIDMLKGAKLALIEVSEGIVCPYLDRYNNIHCSADCWSVDADHYNNCLTVSRYGDAEPDYSTGLVYAGEHCPECGERCSDEEQHSVNDYGDWCCESCMNNNYVHCANDDYYPLRNEEAVYCEDTDEYLNPYADMDEYVEDRHGEWRHVDYVVFSEYQDEYIDCDDAVEVENEDGNIEYVSRDQIANNDDIVINLRKDSETLYRFAL